MSCSVCHETAESHNSHRHKECGHLTHTRCIDMETLNYKLCNVCLNGGEAEEPWPSVDADPHPMDGHDYVLEPGQRNQSSVWSAVTSLIGKRQNTAVPTALDLLQKRVPIDVVMKKHKIGLHHMLKEGANVMDFLSNGYTWNDLLKFEDVSKKGPERAYQTLQALGVSANHFRAFPGQMPWNDIKAHLQMNTMHLCENFGLCYPAIGEPLSCEGDTNAWNATDLVKLGITMDDLISFGITHVEQYQDLMAGLTKAGADEAERKLKTTESQLMQLASFEEEAEEQQQPVVAAKQPEVKMVAPTPLPTLTATTKVTPQYVTKYNLRRARHGTVN